MKDKGATGGTNDLEINQTQDGGTETPKKLEPIAFRNVPFNATIAVETTDLDTVENEDSGDIETKEVKNIRHVTKGFVKAILDEINEKGFCKSMKLKVLGVVIEDQEAYQSIIFEE